MNESRRRHGRMEKIDSGGSFSELAKGAREQFLGKKKGEERKEVATEGKGRSEEDERLRAAMGRRNSGG